MCLVPKRNLTVPFSYSHPQKKIIFMTSKQKAPFPNFLRKKLGVLNFFWVLGFIPERRGYVFKQPIILVQRADIYEVWWLVVNTPYARGVNSV
jgi:hypothetical protein